MPNRLSATALLQLAEQAHGLEAAERVGLFAAVEHSCSIDAVARAAVGFCAASAWALRCRSFGDRALGQTRCTSCAAELELELPVTLLPPSSWAVELPCLQHEGYRVQARLPTLEDVKCVCRASMDLSVARQLLLERCVSWATHDDVAIGVDQLPASVVASVVDQLDTADPSACVLLACDCAACGARCEVSFDPASFFCAELEAEATRLLREVDVLARTYGWSETDILKLSWRRRERYLAMGNGA